MARWREDGFSSLFEIKEVASDKVVVMDVVAEVDYEIYFNVPAKGQEIVKSMPVGSFAHTSILPIKNTWFFSGLQTILPKGSDSVIFETYITHASAHQAFRNNPEKLQRVLESQKEHYQIFIDTFGTDELIVPLAHAKEKLQEYYDNLGRNDPCYCGSGKKFKKCHDK